MIPQLGKSYVVPSGMGGVFTARVLAIHEAAERSNGTFVPASIQMRVVAPRNHDWHDYLFTMRLDYFERVAKEA